MKLLCMFMIAVMSYAFAPKAEAKGWFLSKDNRQKRKAKRSVKQAKRAEKACGKGKARKCARLKRKSAANKYAGETGDFSGARHMKRSSRKLRRAKKACRKGKGRKCDRLQRKASFQECMAEGGSRKSCRIAKRGTRREQRAYRKGFSDKNVNPLRGALGAATVGGAIGYGASQYGEEDESLVNAFGLSQNGCSVERVSSSEVDNVNYFKTRYSCEMAQSNYMASNCQAGGGSWNGQSCVSAGASRGIGSTFNKASRFIPVSGGGSQASSGQQRQIIKSVGGSNSGRQITTFGRSSNDNSIEVGGSLGD